VIENCCTLTLRARILQFRVGRLATSQLFEIDCPLAALIWVFGHSDILGLVLEFAVS
jgi:hypothetical protein